MPADDFEKLANRISAFAERAIVEDGLLLPIGSRGGFSQNGAPLTL